MNPECFLFNTHETVDLDREKNKIDDKPKK